MESKKGFEVLKDIVKTKAGATLAGLAIAAVLFFVPEAKPIACGAGFTIPFLASGEK